MSNTKRKHLRFTSHPGPVPCSAASPWPRCLPLGLLEQEGGPGQGARVPGAPGTSWSLLQGSTLPVSVRQQRKIFALKDLPAPCLCPACCRQTFPALPSWLQIPENCQPGPWCWGRAGLPAPGPPVWGLALPVRAQAPTAGGIREPDGNAAPSTRLGGKLDYK